MTAAPDTPTHAPELASREMVELAAELDRRIDAHLYAITFTEKHVAGVQLNHLLWDNKVGILRALQSLPDIEAAALERAASRVALFSGDGKFCNSREAELIEHLAAAIRALKPEPSQTPEPPDA